MTWFYTLCVISIIIVTADMKGTLEPAVNKFEEKLGIRTEVPSDTTDTTKVSDEIIIRYKL
tara:strand:- start:2682 stop:2864 length:183 start_codon:yes stop_codon:yes gene_type:complete